MRRRGAPSRAGRNFTAARYLVLISATGSGLLRTAVRPEGLGHLKKLNDFIRNRIRDLPAYSTVSQQTIRSSEFMRILSLGCYKLADMAKVTDALRNSDCESSRNQWLTFVRAIVTSLDSLWGLIFRKLHNQRHRPKV